MRTLVIFACLSAASGAAVRRSSYHNSTSASKALYFLENDPAGANIVSLQVAEDGTLSNPIRTSTGGKGLLGVNANGPAPVDALFSQDAVVVSKDLLLTVSPGSGTLSIFHIPKHDPTHPILIGEPITTGGDVPNSVAFSPRHNLACVAHTGPRAGVRCFSLGPAGRCGRGSDTAPPKYTVQPASDFLPFPAPLLNQTSPPMGPPGTTSDIVFNPSQTALFVTIKGAGGSANSPGYILAYPIVPTGSRHGDEEGAEAVKSAGAVTVDPNPIISRPPELTLDFSLTFLGDDDTRAFVADPSHGGAFIHISSGASKSGPAGDGDSNTGGSDRGAYAITTTRSVTVPGQGATCWSRYDRAAGLVYLFDAAVAAVTALDAATGDIVLKIPGPGPATNTTAAGGGGSFDAVVSGDRLYVLEMAAGIAVYDLGARGRGAYDGAAGAGVPQVLQSLDLSMFGKRQYFQGLAAWPA